MKEVIHIFKQSLPAGRRGFTIFFAMLAASLALAIGLAIYDLTVRETDLSSAATESQYAIYAADTGAECALYWDAKYSPAIGGVSSAFGTSTAATWAASGVDCNAEDITTQGPPAVDSGRYNNAPTSPWYIQQTANSATTTFSILLPSTSGGTITTPGTYCAVVQVGKYTDGNGVLYTTVISRGYNSCAPSGVTRYERTLQVSY